MKTAFKRALPVLALVVALLIVLSTAGCETILYSFRRAFLGATATPATIQETPMFTPTPAPDAAHAQAANPKWAQWRSDAEKKLPQAVPLDTVFAAPEYSDPTVSPDGRQVLYRHIVPGGTDTIVVRNMQTEMETTVQFPPATSGVPRFTWSGDSRHVLFMIDRSGDENFGIYSVDIASGKSQTIYSKAGVDATIVSLDEADPNIIFYQSNARNPQCFDLYRFNLSTGKSDLMLQNSGSISGWYFDHQGNFRIVETMDDKGGEHLLLRKTGKTGTAFAQDEWTPVLSWAYEDTDTSFLFDISVDGNRIFYADSTDRNTAALMEMNLTTGRTTLVDSNPDYDVAGMWLDLKMDKPTAARYVEDRAQWKALDGGIGAQLKGVQQINPGDFDFTSSSHDDRYWLIGFDNDTTGRAYYYIDSQTGVSTFLFDESPALKGYTFAKQEPIQFTASDGLKIHGYATFPVGLERKNLPMVLLVHGGPQYRDTWGWDEETQWLANCGYMVVRVNFRGSTGYGKQFIAEGNKEWGGKMQQDLTDAVNWAVSQGYADKSRIAIMGASYGGYAALAGAAFTPDVYACAVDMFGPSDLATLVNSSPDYWQPFINQMYRSIGNPNTEADFMKSRSPLYSVDKIKIPILIAQGGNDVRVTKVEAEAIVSAMRAKNLYVDYLFFPNAGHGFNQEEDYQKFYTEAENFLAQYIGGRAGS